ncbi:MAG: hypothetical protein P4L99_23435 [Chthoniobacter sp.]|nr:hypothetical protein [Chthoniobacter sp.]
MKRFLLLLALILPFTLLAEEPVQVSGIYPHLASFNNNGECGIGAVVPWAGKLWWITYPPHLTHGSTDKLNSITPDMRTLEMAPESVGGTHACRMIHRESNQLIIGPYFIDAEGHVRAVDVKTQLVGRMTAIARHLTDPANLVYFYDMEGALYEVNVHSLEVKKLFTKPVPGWHGKGAYTAQGRLVIANNGEEPVGGIKIENLAELPPKTNEDRGVLAEYDGKDWRIIERRQFTDVTGPGGINGSPDDKSPLWTIGWDKRSVILKVLDGGEWSTFRLPKGSLAFDPWHGWYTEWPRIREVNDGRFLMDMHGQFFDFPRTFSRANTAGIRPLATHLRYVPDFCAWGDKLVIASDDTSIMRNPLAGQSQSNLWFGKLDDLKSWGPTAGWGGVWVDDTVKAGVPSDPFQFAGWQNRMLHLANDGGAPIAFTIEADENGSGSWKAIETISVPARGSTHHEFSASTQAEWVRIKTDADTKATAYFHCSNPNPHAPSTGTPQIDPAKSALIRPAQGNRNLQVVTPNGYYEVDETLSFTAKDQPGGLEKTLPRLQIPVVASVDAASVIVTDHLGRRWRLPKTDAAYDAPATPLRAVREVESERFLGNIHGILYEIPRATGKGDLDPPDFQKMKPLATHRSALVDFCTWRGLLVMSGGAAVPGAGRTISSPDGKVSLWFGKTDDLWRFGKAVGEGGPWKDTDVRADAPSEPYLMTNFDRKSVTLSHDGAQSVNFKIEVDALANGTWREYATLAVKPGETLQHEFPTGFGAHWVRVRADAAVKATATFHYE